jgi:hypothetical protein
MHDFRPLDHLLGRVCVSHNPFELGPIPRTKHDFNLLLAHATNESDSRQNRIQMFVAEH